MLRTLFMFGFLLAVPCTGWCAKPTATYHPDHSGFQRIVQPFLEKHCIKCHGPDLAEADFRVDSQLSTDFLNYGVAQKWREVRSALDSGGMPPQAERQPSTATVRRINHWIEREQLKAERSRNSGNVVMRRLNRSEYNNTIRDLIGIDIKPANDFPEDPPTSGFDNIGIPTRWRSIMWAHQSPPIAAPKDTLIVYSLPAMPLHEKQR